MMSFVPRIYVDANHQFSKLVNNELYILPLSVSHYLGNVLRLKKGDSVVLFNNEEGEWMCEIEQPSKNKSFLFVKKQIRSPINPVGPTLLFAPLKRDATDLAIRMATELGVKTIQPVQTMRTNSHRIKEERLKIISIEAAEQSERLTIPKIKPIRPLFEICDYWFGDQPLLVALERCQERLIDSKRKLSYNGNEGLLIGPEGGFDEREIKKLLSYQFVVPLSLGNLVLKAETAIVTGLAKLFPYIKA